MYTEKKGNPNAEITAYAAYRMQLQSQVNVDLTELIAIRKQYEIKLEEMYNQQKQRHVPELEKALECLLFANDLTVMDDVLDLILENETEEDAIRAKQVYRFMTCFKNDIPYQFLNTFIDLLENEFSLVMSKNERSLFKKRAQIIYDFDYTVRTNKQELLEYHYLRKVIVNYIILNQNDFALKVIEKALTVYSPWQDELEKLLIVTKVCEYKTMTHKEKMKVEKEVENHLYNNINDITYLYCHIYLRPNTDVPIKYIKVRDKIIPTTKAELVKDRGFLVKNNEIDIFIKTKLR